MTTTIPPSYKFTSTLIEGELDTALKVAGEDIASIPHDLALSAFDTDIEKSDPSLHVPWSAAEPWGQVPGEPDDRFLAFIHFLSLGLVRTRSQVSRDLSIAPRNIYKWATSNDWDTRARAWDMHRERLYQLEMVQETKKMAREHGRIAARGIYVLAQAWDELVRRQENEPEYFASELAEIPMKTLINIAQKSARVIPNLMNAERLSRGLPTEISSSLHQEEQVITLQTSDDLAELVAGLAGIIRPSPQLAIIDGNAIEDTPPPLGDDDGDGEGATA